MGVRQHPFPSFAPTLFKRLCSIGLRGGLHSAQGSVCEAPGVSCQTLCGLCLHDGETVKGSLPIPFPSTDSVGSLPSFSFTSAPPCWDRLKDPLLSGSPSRPGARVGDKKAILSLESSQITNRRLRSKTCHARRAHVHDQPDWAAGWLGLWVDSVGNPNLFPCGFSRKIGKVVNNYRGITHSSSGSHRLASSRRIKDSSKSESPRSNIN